MGALYIKGSYEKQSEQSGGSMKRRGFFQSVLGVAAASAAGVAMPKAPAKTVTHVDTLSPRMPRGGISLTLGAQDLGAGSVVESVWVNQEAKTILLTNPIEGILVYRRVIEMLERTDTPFIWRVTDSQIEMASGWTVTPREFAPFVTISTPERKELGITVVGSDGCTGHFVSVDGVRGDIPTYKGRDEFLYDTGFISVPLDAKELLVGRYFNDGSEILCPLDKALFKPDLTRSINYIMPGFACTNDGREAHFVEA